MACGPCEKRRQMIAEARRNGGIKAVLKAVPSVIRDTVKNPPKLVDKRKG